MNDDARRIMAQLPVPWDELRERRVLGKVEAKLAERRASRRRRPWWLAAGAGGALLAAAIAVFAVLSLRPADTLAPSLSLPRVAATAIDESALKLPDGSLAQMHTGARVDVDVQTDALVRLVQHAGVVRYEVTKNPGRRFVVDADGVEVRVIGTVFTVALGDDDVRVSVERGKVEVAGADRVAQLGAGDELKLDRPAPVDEPIVLDEDVVIEIDGDTDDGQGRPGVRGKKPTRPSEGEPGATAEELQSRADAARVRGELDEAARALSELVRRYPKHPLAYSSYFQLGKVERTRGRHAAAATAFTACHQRAPSGSLAEDARAEAAASWLAAGQRERAATAAQAYLDRYPAGASRDRMQRILDKTK